MRTKCAIFDFDGTLFDSMSVWDGVGEAFLRACGKEPRPSLREDVRALSLHQSACYFRREYGISLPAEEIMNRINRLIEDAYIYEVLPKPGVTAFLDRMPDAGISMCIATATDRYLIEAALSRCDMTRYFDAIFTCGEIGNGKDTPVIFRTAMAYLGADRNATVVFEDSLHAVQTAKSDGFAVAAVFDSSENQQQALRLLADCYIPDFAHTDDFWAFASAK